MSISTKKGDKGNTYLNDKPLSKDHELIDLIGHLDEVMALFVLFQATYGTDFKEIVETLSLITAIVAGYQEAELFDESKINKLDEVINNYHHESGGFVYFYEDQYKATLNHLRTVVRRLERVMTKAFLVSKDYPIIQKYVNRLSDYVYVLMNIS